MGLGLTSYMAHLNSGFQRMWRPFTGTQHNKKIKDFDHLKTDYQLNNLDYFRYLQLRKLLPKEHFHQNWSRWSDTDSFSEGLNYASTMKNGGHV